MEILELTSVLGLGFLIGLQHAFDADHIAAVTTMISETKSVKKSSLTGVTWGLGHTATLFLAGFAVLFFKTTISEHLAISLEFFVGAMLVFLGARAWGKVQRDKIHVHTHKHDGTQHVHLHSHKHTESHRHRHLKYSFVIGLVHGLAGSAGLMLLVLASLPTVTLGILYILVFGAGAMIGMMIVSSLLGVSFMALSKLVNAEKIIQLSAGTLSAAVGVKIMVSILVL